MFEQANVPGSSANLVGLDTTWNAWRQARRHEAAQ
jgi:hypothetical protein